MGLEQKKFFESGVAAERARILEELGFRRRHWAKLFEESDGYDSNVGSRYGGALTAIDDFMALIRGEN